MNKGDESQVLRRRFEREHRARLEAENIAERATADLYNAVTQLEQLNAALERANDELEAANTSIREFVAIASHDLRSPLTAVVGFAELLRERWQTLPDEQKLEFVGIIEGHGHRVERLVEDLLTVSSLEAGKVEAKLQRLYASRELRRCIRELGEPFADVLVDAVDDDVAVMADPDHLQRILVNYLSNALKYGSPPVVAETADNGEFVEFRVRDSGDGVPQTFVPRLFGMFARDESKASRSAGTGLGLAIVRGLAEANGGAAWYEPNHPSGSCFVVRLPRMRA